MKKSLLALAVIAASCSVATAKDAKQVKVSTVAATQMTDAEMDTVTAGAANFQQMCTTYGQHCHSVGGGGQSWHREANNGYIHSGHRGAHFIPAP
jgi:hypothetical protein